VGLQLRPKGSGDPMYSPERDFAYSHTSIVQCIINAFNSDRWPYVFELLVATVPKESTVTDEAHADMCWGELVKVKDVYCEFCNICCEDSDESYEDVIARSGWGDVPGPYRVAWLSMLGVVMTGQLFTGLRDVTAEATPRSTHVEDLLKHSHESRLIHNYLSTGDDLKSDLKAVVEKLRDEDVSWEVIDRIINREKAIV
jgi:hypothetical protein